MNVKIRKVNSEDELDIAFAIRTEVFVVEQKVPEEIEWDEFEKTSHHILAWCDMIPVGTARWRATKKGIKLERFAVLNEWRSKGVGSKLVKFILTDLDSVSHIYLHAQERVVPFYEQFGFKQKGNKFFEANIPHWLMELN